MEYKVLAADDETELLDALELYTETENIRLIKADNGITALELFKTEKPHLVLLDIMMPGLDGFAVLKRIRTESHVPAIMFTARGEDYDKNWVRTTISPSPTTPWWWWRGSRRSFAAVTITERAVPAPKRNFDALTLFSTALRAWSQKGAAQWNSPGRNF